MNLELKDIISSDFQYEIQDSLAFATGFGVVFVDKAGRHIGDGGNFCRFCRAINNTEEGREACEQSNLKAIKIALQTHQSSIYLCHAGLVSFVIPMLYDGEYIGAITAGQVLCDGMEDYPRYSPSSQNWLDNPELQQYHSEIRVFSRQQVESAAVAFRNISNYIVQKVAYNKMKQELLETQTKRLQLEHQLKLAELNALQKQVTPHFIFNVLSSVTRLLESCEYQAAEKMLNSFTQMMRYTLYDANATVTLAQELGYIRNYLAIQQIRFGERIRYNIDCPTELNQLLMPFFALQPLVENAIEHGLLPRVNGGVVDILCCRKDSGVVICIQDNGVGIPADKLESLRRSLDPDCTQGSTDHVGLYNSSRRFFHMYENKVSFSLDSTLNVGAAVHIFISDPIGIPPVANGQ